MTLASRVTTLPAGGGGGAQAQFAQDHPVAQRAPGLVVGQREFGMRQHREDGFPVVKQLDRQGTGFRMRAALARRAGGAQCGE